MKIIELVASDDERVAPLAACAVWDRSWGKPGLEKPDEHDRPRRGFDLSGLTAADRAALLRIAQKSGLLKVETGDED